VGRSIFPLPLHLGHESVAEVIEVGPEVVSVRVGDRVVVPFQISCGHCAACRRGHSANCLSVPPISMYGFGISGGLWGGALADLMAVPFADAMLVPLPDGVDPAAAAGVADNITDCYRQVAPHLPSLLATDPDAETLIGGRLNARHPFTPSAVLFTALIARALGGRRVSVVDGRPALQERAEALGFTALDPRRTRDWPIAPLTVDATGTPVGLRTVLKHTAPDGICSCVWSLHQRGAIPLRRRRPQRQSAHRPRSHPGSDPRCPRPGSQRPIPARSGDDQRSQFRRRPGRAARPLQRQRAENHPDCRLSEPKAKGMKEHAAHHAHRDLVTERDILRERGSVGAFEVVPTTPQHGPEVAPAPAAPGPEVKRLGIASGASRPGAKKAPAGTEPTVPQPQPTFDGESGAAAEHSAETALNLLNERGAVRVVRRAEESSVPEGRVLDTLVHIWVSSIYGAARKPQLPSTAIGI
jgi:alcohol dehydrogenase